MRTLLMVISGLIIYGSLYPFNFSNEAAAEWTVAIFLAGWSDLGSRGDAIGNILLFMPYGAVASVLVDRSERPRALVFALFVIAFVIAFGVQVVQIWVHSRVPAIGDVWWNLLGLVAGYWGAKYLLRFTGVRWESSVEANFAIFVLGLFIAAELIPFVPSLDLQSFKDSLKPLIKTPAFRLERFMFHAIGIVVAGRALAVLSPGGRDLLYLAGVVLFLWFGKVLVVSTVVSVPLIAGTLAGFIAWSVLRKRVEPGRSNFVLFSMLLTYTVMSLAPFSLRYEPMPFSWLPFAGMLEGSMLANLHGLTERMFMYVSILWLGVLIGARIAGVGVFLAIWVWMMEGAQIWLEGRSGSFTEPLLVLALAYFISRHAPKGGALAMAGGDYSRMSTQDGIKMSSRRG